MEKSIFKSIFAHLKAIILTLPRPPPPPPSKKTKLKFSIKNFLSKCDPVSQETTYWTHLLKKSLMENFIFCAM